MDPHEFLSKEKTDENVEQNVPQDQYTEHRQTYLQLDRNVENRPGVSNESHVLLPAFGSAFVRYPFPLYVQGNFFHNYNSGGLYDDQIHVSDTQFEETAYLSSTAGIRNIARSLLGNDMASDSTNSYVPDFTQIVSSNLYQQNDQTTSFSQSANQVSNECELLNYRVCLPTYPEGNNMPPVLNPTDTAETLEMNSFLNPLNVEMLREQNTTMVDGFPPLNIVVEEIINNKVDEAVSYAEDYVSFEGPLTMPLPVKYNSLPTKYLCYGSSGFDQELNQPSSSQVSSPDNTDTKIIRSKNARVSMNEDDPQDVNSTMDLQAELQVKDTTYDDGEKPFPCKICQKRFTRQSHLAVHSRIHTGEKPYKCEVCGTRFARKGDLTRHSITHSSEKPHECEVCGKKFAHIGSRNRHSRTHYR